MTSNQRLQRLFLFSLILCTAPSLQATDAVHQLTLTLKATSQGDEITRGDTVTTKPSVFRANTADIIGAMAEAKDVTFGPRAQLLLIRRNIGQSEGDEASIVIRETGREDTEVTDLIGFESGPEVETGTFHVPTGRARSTALAIGTLSLQIPMAASLIATGLATEKRGTVNISGEEINSGLTSVSAKLDGQGTITEGETSTFVIAEITLTVGAARLVSSPVQ